MSLINKNLAISENGFLFNPLNGDCFSINPIGIDILQYLKQDKLENEIIEIIIKDYDVDKLIIEKDIKDFLSILKYHQILN